MTETTDTQEQQATLGLTDLALMANIIQVTSQRGAIKAEEMETVGALYKKLAVFVQANAPKTEEEEEGITEEVSTDEGTNEDQ